MATVSEDRAALRALLIEVVTDETALSRRVCRVCLRHTDDLVRLSDTCSVRMSPCAGTYTLAEILKNVMRTKVDDGVLCSTCVQASVEAYVLIRTFEVNTRALERCIEALTCQAEVEPTEGQERVVMATLPRLSNYADVDVTGTLTRRAHAAPHACTMCERTFASRALLVEHEDTHPPGAQHACRHCGNVYKRRRVLNRHLLERHGEGERLLCVTCGKVFSSSYTLFCHQMVYHGTARLYYCSRCGFRTRCESGIVRHIRLHHALDPDAHYSLVEPNDTLRQQLEKAAVDSSQADAKPTLIDDAYTCRVCNEKFPRLGALRRHTERAHRRLECRLCHKIFRTRARYEQHALLHSAAPDLKLYKCQYCDYSARQRRHVVAHTTRRHTNIRPFECEICGKGFVKQNEVRIHMVVHTRERRETCELCHKRFVNKAALLYHTRLHTGEKPYECGVCGERFLSASRRGAHIRSKHGPRPECETCGATYTNNQVLQKHIRNVHQRSTGPLKLRRREPREFDEKVYVNELDQHDLTETSEQMPEQFIEHVEPIAMAPTYYAEPLVDVLDT